ncbi:MAG: NrtA/SsuA/CpmA family ABC transporter substrate-binding protein [Candidatus Sedimenticola sp. (ex Thyasira tokunagai)]
MMSSKVTRRSLLKRHHYWLIVLVVVVGVAFILLPQSTQHKERPLSSENRINIRIGLAMQPTSALAIIAAQQGYFEVENIEAVVSEFPSGKRALRDGLFQDRIDVAVSADVPITMAALEKRSFRIIAATFNAGNVNRVIARTDLGIQTPADLVGKRVATQRASAVHYFLELFMGEHALPHEQVSLRYMKAEKLPQALAEGSIDAFSMREPYISQAKALLGDKAVVFSVPGLYRQIDMVLITEKMLVANPGVAARLLRALNKAEQFVHQQPDDAVAMVAQRLGVEKDKIHALWPTLKLRVSLEQFHLLLLESEARWALRNGLTQATEMPDFMEYIDFTGLQEVNPEAITIFR